MALNEKKEVLKIIYHVYEVGSDIEEAEMGLEIQERIDGELKPVHVSKTKDKERTIAMLYHGAMALISQRNNLIREDKGCEFPLAEIKILDKPLGKFSLIMKVKKTILKNQKKKKFEHGVPEKVIIKELNMFGISEQTARLYLKNLNMYGEIMLVQSDPKPTIWFAILE
tara:strand:- start:13 stop:519 length:507 start_codon:yes stop_codon:yes gene_type:complete